MNSPYLWFKALHTLAAAVWIGSAAALWAITAMMQKHSANRALLPGLASAGEAVGSRVTAAASGLTLVLGIVAMVIGKVGMAFWIYWGMIVAVVLVAVGGGVLKKRFERLAQMASVPSTPQGEIDAIIASILNLGRLAILFLAITVVLMVVKP